MTDHPILFSGEMVRAILRDDKTRTMRIIKPQPTGAPIYDPAIGWRFPGGPNMKCPYGAPGDRLWVRETWALIQGTPYNYDSGKETVFYDADGEEKIVPASGKAKPCDGKLCKWRSPIHMPRWASRITLEVTGVRVHKLWETTEDGAIAEGVESLAALKVLWDVLNAKRGFPWDSNPWVWAVTFRRICG